MTLAPIALFVYNRPWHTRQTVEALLKNDLAGDSNLFIFSDGPKKGNTALVVNEVREYIKRIGGFRSISIVERVENFGLAKSIIDGVTRLCDEFGRVIVLEDDLVTSSYFLRYMNEAIDLYQNEEKVISIHGYIYPVSEELPETFFLRGADCWGWATWQRGWALFKSDAIGLLESLKKKHLEKVFNYDDSYDYMALLSSQSCGKKDSWAVLWYASAFLENKLTLYPGRSLVLNIGLDGSGVHGRGTNDYFVNVTDRPIVVDRMSIIENLQARAAVGRFLSSQNNAIPKRVLKKIISSLNNLFGRCA